MREAVITCPFTGIDFQAVEYSDGSIVARNPLTDEEIKLSYNPMPNCYMISRKHFDRKTVYNVSEAARISGVSTQCISQACKNGSLPSRILPNGSKVITAYDLEYYNIHKAVGRPRKGNADD